MMGVTQGATALSEAQPLSCFSITSHAHYWLMTTL